MQHKEFIMLISLIFTEESELEETVHLEKHFWLQSLSQLTASTCKMILSRAQWVVSVDSSLNT